LNGLGSTYWAPNGIDWWFLPLTALFLHGFHPETINSVVPGGWSIAVEMSFYVVLPFILVRIGSIKGAIVVFLISIVAYVVSNSVIPRFFHYPASQQYLVHHFLYLNFFSQLPIFAAGIILYYVCEIRGPSWRLVFAAAPVLLALVLLLKYPYWRIPYHFLVGALFSTLMMLLAKFPLRILVNIFMIRLGTYSFSIYLVHFAVITLLKRAGISGRFPASDIGGIAFFLMVLALSALFSSFSYRFLERPFVSLGNSLVRKSELRMRTEGS
jgi:peptidoglycan/LPS O-acetylase OafA/YrhL